MVRPSLLAAVAMTIYAAVGVWTWATRSALPANERDVAGARASDSVRARADDGARADGAKTRAQDARTSADDANTRAIDAAQRSPHTGALTETPRAAPPDAHRDTPRDAPRAAPPPPAAPDARPSPDPAMDARRDPDAAVHLRARAPSIGEQLEYATRLDLSLDAKLDMGIFRPTVRYATRETEVLRVTRLPPREGRAVLSLEYVESLRSRTLPVVGEKKEEHRVHGRTFTTVDDAAAMSVIRKSGKPASEKEAVRVSHTARAVGGVPPLHGALGPNGAASLDLGDTLRLDSQDAKRLIGLPIEELDVEDLVLVLRSVDAGVARFEATARLSGQAELGDGHMGLSGRLSGEVLVHADGARLHSLQLDGRISVEQDGSTGRTLATSGSGPLSIRRSVKSLSP